TRGQRAALVRCGAGGRTWWSRRRFGRPRCAGAPGRTGPARSVQGCGSCGTAPGEADELDQHVPDRVRADPRGQELDRRAALGAAVSAPFVVAPLATQTPEAEPGAVGLVQFEVDFNRGGDRVFG